MASPMVILCPGQGAQRVGMGQRWYEQSPEARGMLDQADRLLQSELGVSLLAVCRSGPAATLDRTDISQPAIFAVSMACAAALAARWGYALDELPLSACAGLSLGEYTALCLAGALTFDDALRLVAIRGRAMQAAAEASAGAMLALAGASDEAAESLCEAARGAGVLVCANFNAPGQIVLSGDLAACGRAEAAAAARGLRTVRLPVAGAFHSPLMQPAADRLADALARTSIRTPRCPVVANVTGLPHEAGSSAASIRERLIQQLTSPVRWEASCRWLAANTRGAFHELAPGRTLAGLFRRIDRNVKVDSHDEPE